MQQPRVAAIRTLIVDDEPLARLRLRTLLSEHADFAVVAECGDGGEALEAIARLRPDLVFLDVQMAETSGLDVARTLQQPPQPPQDGVAAAPPPAIVFVTAYDRYAVRAFEVHALDYLLKPFDEERFGTTLQRVREHRTSAETKEAHGRLLAFLRDLSRGEAVLAAVTGSDGGLRARGATALHVADLDVDLRARTVRRAGALIPLRPKEFDLLVALIKRAGEVVSRRDLLHDVWGYGEDVVSRTVDTHMSELRRKLGHTPGEPGHIATISRAGYRLEL